MLNSINKSEDDEKLTEAIVGSFIKEYEDLETKELDRLYHKERKKK